MFTAFRNKGFKMTFANGWTISVQFGPHNYCDAEYKVDEEPRHHARWTCRTAEVAIWTRGCPITLIGYYSSTDEVAQMIYELSSDYAPLYYGA